MVLILKSYNVVGYILHSLLCVHIIMLSQLCLFLPSTKAEHRSQALHHGGDAISLKSLAGARSRGDNGKLFRTGVMGQAQLSLS